MIDMQKGVSLETSKKGVPHEVGTSFDTDISFSGSPFNIRQFIEDKKLPETSKKGVPREAGTSFDIDILLSESPSNMKLSIEDKKLPETSIEEVPCKSMFNYMNEVYADTNLWNYYSIDPEKFDFSKFFISRSSICKEFIDNYISAGCKGFSDLFSKKYIGILSEEKAKHSLSMFFLGICLYKNVPSLKSNIDNLVSDFEDKVNGIHISFAFLWFLICFFHDIAYEFEENSENKTNLKLMEIFKNLNDLYPNLNKLLPEIYNDNWGKYFIYRLSEGKFDHGIIGGLLFYSDLKKMYNTAKKNKQNKEEPFEYMGVYWSKDLLNTLHSYVAGIIMYHNIWFIEEKDKNSEIPQKYKKYKKYRNFKLDELILEDKKTEDFTDYPILSLLLLIDTIDPVKSFKDISPEEVLQSIDLSFKDDEISMSLNLNNFNNEKDVAKFKENLKSLNGWLKKGIVEID